MGPLKTRFIVCPQSIQGVRIVWISELGQKTGSFKYRAAWNVVANIDAPHFLAASSGNFGAALALAAKEAKRGCTIVMPTTSAKVKIEAVKSHGAAVDLIDVNQISRAQRVEALSQMNPEWHVASAYDCHHVIMGNASLGVEIAQSGLDLDRLYVPIGGGGLSSGVLTGLRQMNNPTPVWGAEPEMADDAIRSLNAGVLIKNKREPQTLADGARTVSLGIRNWEILKKDVAGILPVSEENIISAMRIMSAFGLRVEPTGALSTGAILNHAEDLKNMTIGCIISGGNVDQSLYSSLVSEKN